MSEEIVVASMSVLFGKLLCIELMRLKWVARDGCTQFLSAKTRKQ